MHALEKFEVKDEKRAPRFKYILMRFEGNQKYFVSLRRIEKVEF